MPLKAKPMGQKTNPIPLLLADKTLRKGDIVVFPDGPRVFQGKEGGGQVLSDFVKLSNLKVASSSRKLLGSAKIGENDAWDEGAGEVQAKDGKKVAATRRASQPD